MFSIESIVQVEKYLIDLGYEKTQDTGYYKHFLNSDSYIYVHGDYESENSFFKIQTPTKEVKIDYLPTLKDIKRIINIKPPKP
jgi:hypothetical protein